ncbi:unnamed protein product [Adineta ricciae]|uniref:Protein kinase domain-containing protein n=1 Tax=Adineta ricciae TaxID=249248 RepID=A0A814QIH6_ADIRI|nr:unnamed protein product [Adineta ricciae]
MKYISSSIQQTSDIVYIESRHFTKQFCLNQQQVESVQSRSRFCSISIIKSKSIQLDEYLQERQDRIRIFNHLLTKRLRAALNLTLDSFQLLRPLGEGGYGSVFLAYHPDTNEYLALKAITKSSLVETNEQHIILSERQYAFALQHPNIVQFLTSFKDNEYVYLAFEWLQGGDLYSLMSCHQLTELQAKFYSGQIIMALDYLHGCSIAFRDLKPENIVLTGHGYIKLIDLGLAKLIRGFSQTFCGTPHYIEIIMHRPYKFSPDYWTLGIIIHEMVTGSAPYDRTYHFHEAQSIESLEDSRSESTIENDSSDLVRTSSKHYNMYLRIINGCSFLHLTDMTEHCASLIRGLLQHNIEQRLGCGQRAMLDLLEHPWLTEINFWSLYRQKYIAPFLPARKHFLQVKDSDEMPSCFLLSINLVSFLLLTSLISCSSLFLPLNALSYYDNDRYLPLPDDHQPSIKFLTSFRNLRSTYYPRANRNTWFRVSTYQQFKPSGSEETPNGDNLMRWGR